MRTPPPAASAPPPTPATAAYCGHTPPGECCSSTRPPHRTCPESPTWPATPSWPHAYPMPGRASEDRKSTRLNSSHVKISYAVFCLKKKKKKQRKQVKHAYTNTQDERKGRTTDQQEHRTNTQTLT